VEGSSLGAALTLGAVGNDDGELVGVVGAPDGFDDGSSEGGDEIVGMPEGAIVGAVGKAEGDEDGNPDGGDEPVGLSEGVPVGAVGEPEGTGVGAGLSVGTKEGG
jgi:hypothetical protein